MSKRNLCTLLATTALILMLWCFDQVREPGVQFGWAIAMGALAWVAVTATIAAARAES